MTGSMNAAIAGMKSHMNKLNVIGNNVANVNTYGYKPGRVVFTTSQYTTTQSGSNGTALVGGRNPAQIGYGNQISTIDLDMSGGSYSPTGRNLDVTIAGDGFFLVGNKEVTKSIDPNDPNSLKSLTLTRLGRFDIDANGYLVDGEGNCVYGFLNTKAQGQGGAESVCDQLVPIRLPKQSVNGDILLPDTPQQGNRLEDAKDDPNNQGQPPAAGKFDGIKIDPKTGKITATAKDTDKEIVVGYIAMGNVTNPNGVTQESGSYYKAGEGSGDLSVSLMGGVGKELKITHVNGSMDPNAGGGNAPAGMAIGSAGGTGLITGGLEMSKTDLASEIAEMITTQRGYQANTRIITVTDTMLEELVNLKR